MIKYLLCPGWIMSKHDGEMHYITGTDLARLYGVDLAECAPFWDPIPSVSYGDLLQLGPRYEGDYREWLAKQEGKSRGRKKSKGASHRI